MIEKEIIEKILTFFEKEENKEKEIIEKMFIFFEKEENKVKEKNKKEECPDCNKWIRISEKQILSVINKLEFGKQKTFGPILDYYAEKNGVNTKVVRKEADNFFICKCFFKELCFTKVDKIEFDCLLGSFKELNKLGLMEKIEKKCEECIEKYFINGTLFGYSERITPEENEYWLLDELRD